jgi:hypothetical protein
MTETSNPRRVHSARHAPDRSRYRNPDDDARGPYLLVDLTVLGVRPAAQFVWKGHVPPEGRHWRYTLDRAEALEREGRIIWPPNGGRPRLKRFLAETAATDQVEDEEPIAALSDISVERALRSMLQALAQEIARNPDYLARVEWRDLERLLGEVLSGLGFNVAVTRPGRDGGFDLELTCRESHEPLKYLAEVKHWKASRPGPKVLERFLEVVITSQATRGLLLSTSGYSMPALTRRSEIARHRVRLGDGEKIIGLCQSYVRHALAGWRPLTALPEILFTGTR